MTHQRRKRRPQKKESDSDAAVVEEDKESQDDDTASSKLEETGYWAAGKSFLGYCKNTHQPVHNSQKKT